MDALQFSNCQAALFPGSHVSRHVSSQASCHVNGHTSSHVSGTLSGPSQLPALQDLREDASCSASHGFHQSFLSVSPPFSRKTSSFAVSSLRFFPESISGAALDTAFPSSSGFTSGSTSSFGPSFRSNSGSNLGLSPGSNSGSTLTLGSTLESRLRFFAGPNFQEQSTIYGQGYNHHKKSSKSNHIQSPHCFFNGTGLLKNHYQSPFSRDIEFDFPKNSNCVKSSGPSFGTGLGVNYDMKNPLEGFEGRIRRYKKRGKYGISTSAVGGNLELNNFSTFGEMGSSKSFGRGEGIAQGPYCIYVGPIEEAQMSELEALYQQAKDEYYDGHPLILDDMFDKIERRLRWFRSKIVQKYPRCSLKRYSAYADAELDQSQLTALASIWGILLTGGGILFAVPPLGIALQFCQSSLSLSLPPPFSLSLPPSLHPSLFHPGLPTVVNGGLLGTLSMVLGAAMATAAVRSLQGLRKGDLVALKGSCPACGEEVYAFIRADETSRPRHKCECHVCDQPLVFHATLEESKGHLWAYGRIYLVVRTSDLSPSDLS